MDEGKTISISLGTFLDFAAATGETKLRKAIRAKTQYATEYDTLRDYWLPLRRAIESLHAKGEPLSVLERVLQSRPKNKVANYAQAIASYQKWAKGKSIRPAARARETWTSGGLQVRVNPELVLDDKGQKVVIKLYFRRDPLTRARLGLTLHLQQLTAARGTVAALLDVQRGRLHAASRPAVGMERLLAGEAALFVQLWQGF